MSFLNLVRIYHHLLLPKWRVNKYFIQSRLDSLTQKITSSEHKHLGQIKFIVESGWNLNAILQNKSTRQRALEWFGAERVWDTEYNTGVLIYISLADNAVEIIADRGLIKKISQTQWDEICTQMIPLFEQKQYIEGLELGLENINELLIQMFPRIDGEFNNELSDEIIVR